MSEEPVKTEIYWEHPRWLHVIIPIGKSSDPIFIAYCPTCSTYVSQYVRTPNGFDNTREGKINLPQYGCVGPE
jgi:hypothetical protein